MIFEDDICFNGDINASNKFLGGAGQYDRENALYKACSHGHLEIVRLLISKGENSNTGFTNACNGGHLEIVKFLISKGANDWTQVLSQRVLMMDI